MAIREWTLLRHAMLCLPPATEVAKGNAFRGVCQSFCPRGLGWGWVPGGEYPPTTWHLPHMVSKRAVRMLLECFLVW